MGMTFGCNPQIIVLFLSQYLGLKYLDTGYLVNATTPTVLDGSFFKLSRCFCLSLKMCMPFGCNPNFFQV